MTRFLSARSADPIICITRFRTASRVNGPTSGFVATALRHAIGMFAFIALGITAEACAHGSMSDPPSRVFKIFQDNPESPQSDAARAAIAVSGTQAFYDWHEVSLNIPSLDYQGEIPNGRLASAGRKKYAGLDLARTDWFATPAVAGPRVCRFCAMTPHEPSHFLAFITKSGYDPRQPLHWNDLVALPGGESATLIGSCGKSGSDCQCGATGAPMHYEMTLDFPERVGRHVLFVVWQRDDPAGEAFFSTSDLDFGGVDYGEGGDGSDPQLIPLATDFRLVEAWVSGGQAEFTVTNPSLSSIEGWTVAFDWEATLSSLWNGAFAQTGARTTITNLHYNGSLAPGESLSFGCIYGALTPAPSPTKLVAWGRLPFGSAPCRADTNGDRTVNAADLSALLSHWGFASTADVDENGITDAADLAAVLAAWGSCDEGAVR